MNCSVARALAVVGERWSLLIVREALDGARRFGEFRDRLGIASNLLAARLDTLVAAGVLRRVPYQEAGSRPRMEYHLTEQGQDLRPTLITLLEWGDKYLADPQGPSVIVRHGPPSADADDDTAACDEPVRVVLECAAGRSHLPPRRSTAPPAQPRSSWHPPGEVRSGPSATFCAVEVHVLGASPRWSAGQRHPPEHLTTRTTVLGSRNTRRAASASPEWVQPMVRAPRVRARHRARLAR